jgi:hypothetical protein
MEGNHSQKAKKVIIVTPFLCEWHIQIKFWQIVMVGMLTLKVKKPNIHWKTNQIGPPWHLGTKIHDQTFLFSGEKSLVFT